MYYIWKYHYFIIYIFKIEYYGELMDSGFFKSDHGIVNTKVEGLIAKQDIIELVKCDKQI